MTGATDPDALIAPLDHAGLAARRVIVGGLAALVFVIWVSRLLAGSRPREPAPALS